MVVHGIRVRHQQRAHARRRQLGNRQRACTADHQIGIAVGRNHIVDKFAALRPYAVFAVGRLKRVQFAAPGLVAHIRAYFSRQCGQCRRHGFIQYLRPQAAADDQNFQTAFTSGKAFGGRRQIGNIGADGIADQSVFRSESLREGIQHTAGDFRQHPVGQTCHGVLFMNHNRHAAQFRRHAAGESNKTAEADDAGDPVFPDNSLCFADGFEKCKRQRQFALDAVAAHTFNRQFLQQDVVLRHNPLFHRTFAAQPNHMLPRRL